MLQYMYMAQVAIAGEASTLLLLESTRVYQLKMLDSFVVMFLISPLNVCRVVYT